MNNSVYSKHLNFKSPDEVMKEYFEKAA